MTSWGVALNYDSFSGNPRLFICPLPRLPGTTRLRRMTTNWSSNIAVSVMDSASREDPAPLWRHASTHLHMHTNRLAVFFSFFLPAHSYIIFSSVSSVYVCSGASASASRALYQRLRVCARRSLEAVLTQLSDYSGILGHREIRPIGKTTGTEQRKYHSVVLMKQHRAGSWLSDLTLRGFKTNPGKVRETKFYNVCACKPAQCVSRLCVSVWTY